MLLHTGRFSPEKRQRLLVEAFADLRSRFGELYLVFCGDGPLLGSTREYARSVSAGTILFPGRVADVGEHLAAADLFVLPSDFEGMPNAMMEAMANGVAAVSTDRSGITDIARHGEEALMVPAGARRELSEAIAFLLENPEERRRIARNARARVGEFSMPEMAARFNDTVRGLFVRTSDRG